MGVNDQDIDVLIAEYEQAREDERAFVTVQAALFSLALAALGLLAALVRALRSPSGSDLPQSAVAASPFVVIALMLYAETLGEQAVLRSFYLRVIEREIRRRLPSLETTSYPKLRAISWSELETEYRNLRSGRGFFRFMSGGLAFILWLIFGGATILLALEVSLPWRLSMLFVFGTGALVAFVRVIRFNATGRERFAFYVGETDLRLNLSLEPTRMATTPNRENLSRYLLLPHADDLIKASFTAAGLALALNLVPHKGVAESALLAAAFELLIYQARYQWNDIRGRLEDAAAPLASARRRLPSSAGADRVSSGVLLARLLLALVVVSIKWNGDRWSASDGIFALATAATVVIAIAYEQLRDWLRRREYCGSISLCVLLALVICGYPLRFATGFLLVTPLVGRSLPDAMFPALISCAALGLMFVSMTWALEAASYTSLTESGARPRFVSARINIKPHLLRVLRLAGYMSPVMNQPLDDSGAQWKIFRTPATRIYGTWTIGLIAATIFLYDFASKMVTVPSPRVVPIVLALPIITFTVRHQRAVVWHLAIVLMAAVVIVGVGLQANGWSSDLLYPLVALLPAVVYVQFCSLNYIDSRNIPHKLDIIVANGWGFLKNFYFGS